MKTGLTSVSFRKLSCDEVIALAREAGVDGIEWGSDVHVPQNDVENAALVAKKTKDAGLEVISYGSYFTLGCGEDFAPYIEAAKALGARQIRIWGGKKERRELSDDEYADLLSEMKKIGEMAGDADMAVSLEYHQRSITATAEDAAKFASDVDMPSVRLYWQEIIGRPMADNLADIDLVAPYLTNVHVFNYIEGKQELLETGDGLARWRAYSDKIAKIPGERAFMTEFCKGGLPESFTDDARTLCEIVKK